MKKGNALIDYSLAHPKLLTWVMIIITILLGLCITRIKIDTDPENMLSKDEAVRVFHDHMKEVMSLNDMVVVGVVDEEHEDGVFAPSTLSNIYLLTEHAKTLRWDDPDNSNGFKGVVDIDIIAPSTVDNVEAEGLGVIRFEWLMPTPPKTKEDALAVKDKALQIPFLDGTLVSEDGKAIALYVPLTSKDMSYKVAEELKKKIAEFDGEEKYYITGLPVAEDTFGVEMFKQMAISAPIAMIVIFILMLFFFRKLVLIISPMIVAMVSVITTMGLLTGLGYTVHIMSSMIPIFIMPIAVLDSIHILSEFFDRYQAYKDRKDAIRAVMDELFMPMLYTSLTSAAGFASLALTPIPPVQVFGIFVAIGIMTAWILTITFIPAYVMFIPQKKLENFGATHGENEESTKMTRLLASVGAFTYKRAKLIIALSALLIVVALYGISLIQINDNPTKWFTKSHPIRVADRVLNDHFGGTYMAYLSFAPGEEEIDTKSWLTGFTVNARKEGSVKTNYIEGADTVFNQVAQKAEESPVDNPLIILSNLHLYAQNQIDATDGDTSYAWEEAMYWIEAQQQGWKEIFKQPEVLKYLEKLQKHLTAHPVVGKMNSVVDIVKTVHRELYDDEEKFAVPDSQGKVAECLFQYQNSHRPHDLWHMVTPDYRQASMWLQLKSGDNKDMAIVADVTAEYIKKNPPPRGLKHKWFGLTYINVVWQDKMVSGMLQAFLGSFLIVFIMMTIFFRSAIWGFLCMIPLTVTIGMIYGAVGYVGKDYDMPIAVLSSLTLGLAVDFAIHFLARTRKLVEENGGWKNAASLVFGEPARAITRNVIVIAVGFLPLLAAPLVPYKTVGVFLATILAVSGIGTLIILPALVTVFEKWLFPKGGAQQFRCNCGTCIISGIAMVLLIAINIHQFFAVGLSYLTWISLGAIIVLAVICRIVGRHEKCREESAAATSPTTPNGGAQ